MTKKTRITLADVDPIKLNRYLTVDYLSNKVIGAIYGCSTDFIEKCINHYGLTKPTRSQIYSTQFKNGRSINCKILDVPTKEDIEYLHHERKYPLITIATMFDTSIPTLKKWIESYGIEVLTAKPRKNSVKMPKFQQIDKEQLNRYLNVDYLSNIAIAKIFNCSSDLIQKCIDHYKLSKPSYAQIAKTQYDMGRAVSGKIEPPPKEDIEYLYIERLMPLKYAAQIFDVTINTLLVWMGDYDIPQRSTSEQQRMVVNGKNVSISLIGEAIYDRLIDKTWLENEIKTRTVNDIANELGVHQSTVHDYLRRHSLNISRDIVYPRISKTVFEKYGVENYRQLHMSIDTLRKLNDPEWLEIELRIKSMQLIADELGVTLPTVFKYVHLSGVINNKDQTIDKIIRSQLRDVHEFIRISKSVHGEKYNYDWVSYAGSETHVKIICPEHGEFFQRPKYHVQGNGCPMCDNRVSSAEYEIVNYIRSIYSGPIIQSDRILIAPHEVDIYLPEKKLAIEFNGIYWHSEQQGKGRNYHLRKTITCEKHDVQLIHIFENEWTNDDSQEIWKSVLSNKIGVSNHVIGARQTRVIRIQKEELRRFLENNHLQGACASAIHFALEYGSRIVAVMSFGQSRYTNSSQWELLRYATLKGFRVMGGASKLLAHFRRMYSGSIVSYANRRWSNGNLYRQMGFTHSHNTDPNYFYWNAPSKLESRLQYQKHKLAEKIDIFDPDLSEYDNMLKNGYDRIFDCGNMVFRLE